MRFGAAKTIYTQPARLPRESDLDQQPRIGPAASAPLQVRAAYAFPAPTPTMGACTKAVGNWL